MFRIAIVVLLVVLSVVPVYANGWFPKLNERGEVASGAGEISLKLVTGDRQLGIGWIGGWINNDWIVYNGADNNTLTVLFNVRDNRRIEVPQSYNFYAAGGGQWMGTLANSAPFTRRYSGDQIIQEIPDSGVPTMATNGKWAYLTPWHDNHKTLVVNGSPLVSGQIFDVALTPRAVVWSTFTGRATKAVFGQLNGGPTQNISVLDWEGPIACDAADTTWVVSVTQTGLIARKFGATRGYSWHGEFFNPSCVVLNGQLRIASSSSRGELQVISPSGPEVDLREPVVTPPPPPTPPQRSKLPEAVCKTLMTERGKYPADLTPVCRNEGDPNCPIGAILNATAWAHRDLGFGLSRKEAGFHVVSPVGRIASDILERKSDLLMWDVFVDAGLTTRVNCGEDIGPGSRPFVDPVDPQQGSPPPPPPSDDVDQLKAENVRLRTEIHALRGLLTDTEIARDAARRRVTELERERDDLKASIDNKDRRIAELEVERDGLKRQLEEASKPVSCQLVGQRRVFGLRIGGRCEAVR